MTYFDVLKGGRLQSPDHQIGFDQYRRSGGLYSTDAYVVHPVPRFGVNMVICEKTWKGLITGFEIHRKNGLYMYIWLLSCKFFVGKSFF